MSKYFDQKMNIHLYGLIWFDGFDVGYFEFEQVSGSDSVVAPC